MESFPDILIAALGLTLIFEGVLPFVAPRIWRQAFRRITELRDGQLRFFGLVSLALGLLLILLVT